jgi:hypothetical protein
MPEIHPNAASPVVHSAPVFPATPEESAEIPSDSADISISRVQVAQGAPKLSLRPPSDANFLRSPSGHLATSLITPFLAPADSIRLAQTSRALHEKISKAPEFRLPTRYLRLRKNYVLERKFLSRSGAMFDPESVGKLLALSRMSPRAVQQSTRHSNVNDFLNLRAKYITQCMAIAAECHLQNAVPSYPLLKKLDDLLRNWDNITSTELLVLEEELVACMDNSSKVPQLAYELHGQIWVLEGLEAEGPAHIIDCVREVARGLIDNTRERLLELMFSAWHSANDPVAPSRPPANRVRFFHHPPAIDWTSDIVLVQPADMDPATGRTQTNEDGHEWTQSAAWPRPNQGETRHEFQFRNPGGKTYCCIHVFNSVPAPVNMDEPD